LFYPNQNIYLLNCHREGCKPYGNPEGESERVLISPKPIQLLTDCFVATAKAGIYPQVL